MDDKEIKALNKIMAKARKQGDTASFARASILKDQVLEKRKGVLNKEKQTVSGSAERIKTKEVQKLKSGSDFQNKIVKKLKKGGKKLPGLAGMAIGLGSFLSNPSNAAAAEAVGVDTLGTDRAIEDPTSPQFKARMRMLKKRKKR